MLIRCTHLFIAFFQAEDDLLPQEFDDIWDRAPKFPDAIEKNGKERIDVDSFVQVYRDIDDMFEADDELEAESGAPTAVPGSDTPKQSTSDSSDAASSSSPSADTDYVAVEENDEKGDSFEAELESVFEQICDDKTGLLTKAALKGWDEIQKLLADGMLGEDDLEDLWSKTKKSNGGSAEETLDVEGFLSFNVALDDLFDFEDENVVDAVDAGEVEGETVTSATNAASGLELRMVEGENLSPNVLFGLLADENGLVGFDELKRWQELQDMMNDGDLGISELKELFWNVKKSEMDLNKVEESGFVALCMAINDLFEDDGGELAKEPDSPRSDRKAELLDAIADLEVEGLLACGLEATDRDQREILSIVEQLEQEPTNMIRFQQTPIVPKDLDGTWALLFTSSSAMKFNKGLSGLGGSFPNGRFGNLKQKLTASKFLTDVEYIEHIEVTPKNASFDVTVTGTWDLRNSVSLFTGEPSVVMSVQPDRVSYGPTSTRADHWKSLGPMNMLDISYLDEDLRIMRGNTSVENLFVFRRIS